MADEEDHFLLGLLAAAVSILSFGFYAVPLRLKRVVMANVSPMVFHFYCGTTVAIVSMLMIIYNPVIWSWYGVLGGALWVTCQPLFFTGVSTLGLTVAPPVVCGITIFISFLWGYGYFHEEVKSVYLCVLAIVIMIVGIVLITLTGSSLPEKLLSKGRTLRRGMSLGKYQVAPDDMEIPEISSDQIQESGTLEDDGQGPERELSMPAALPIQKTVRTKKEQVIGLVCCIIVGVLNGSIMVPVSLFTLEYQGQYPGQLIALSYLFSFGVGVLMSTPPVALVYFFVKRERPVLHFKVTVLPGMVAGVLWGVGNIAAVYAVAFLGNVIGFPLTQTNIVVGGVLGIIYFKEINGFAIFFFAFATLVLLGGVGMLAYFGAA